jgi:hypothetical protein
MMRFLVTILLIFLVIPFANSQVKDSVTIIVDTGAKKKHSPKKAAIRSAILPGLGQIYNKKYWKLPIVYTAIGIPIGTFIYNKKWYNLTKDAAKMISTGDTINYKNRVDSRLYIFFEVPEYLNALLNARNEFRRNMDYSILFVLLFWGLNVVDATVDAHLKDFDIGDNLSLKIKPSLLQGNQIAGLSLTLSFGRNSPKTITSR